MRDSLVYVLGVLVVGGLLFLGASWLLGRGESQPSAELDRSPVELPDDRPVTADDVRALQISVALRGYRMTEVDWLIDQLARTLEERDADIASLRARLRGGEPGATASAMVGEAVTPGTDADDGPAEDDQVDDEQRSGA